ncbi:MAG: polysaccharide biosynthesis PFTS motif protein [Gallionella sp.]
MITTLFSPFAEALKKWRRARLRRAMRGYRLLQQSGRVELIAQVKQALTEYRLNITSRDLSFSIMGQGGGGGEIAIRQYLLVRSGDLNLNFALLLALGKKNGRVVFYLPKEWRSILEEHGFKVAHVRCGLLWQLYVGAVLFYGMLQIGKILLGALSLHKNKILAKKRYVSFIGLGPGNLPQRDGGNQSHDVISWYLQWPGRAANIEAVCHTVHNAPTVRVDGVEVLPAKRVLPDLKGARAVVSYAFWGLRASLIATFDYLRGRWWHALLLNQAAPAAQVRALPDHALARQYLFHNSGWMYRPLWTYEAEQRGSEILFYFYSTNCESFKRPEGYPPILYGWKAMTWPRYLVWDEYQDSFVRRAVGAQANISIVGPIWFQSSTAEMPRLEKPGVAIFDIVLFRKSRYCTMGADYEYYVLATSQQFLADIAEATQKLDAVMLWKRKRKFGAVAHPQYRHFAESLLDQEHVVLVDPDISALRVIESSCAVVSMPYTSTAVIAKAMGKPSVYYDPTGLLQRDDRAAHGIPILSGVAELRAWLSSQIGFDKERW